VKKQHVWFAAGYLIGSFFGVRDLLGLFVVRRNGAKAA
jgi:hypothetical protein